MSLLSNLYNHYFGRPNYSLDNPNDYKSMSIEKLDSLMNHRNISALDVIDDRDPHKNTVLSYAIAADNLDLVKFLSDQVKGRLNEPCQASPGMYGETVSFSALRYSQMCMHPSKNNIETQREIQRILIAKQVQDCFMRLS